METKILGISGKKQAGKNTATNYMVGSFMKALELIAGEFKITPSGDLWVSDILGDDVHAGIFNIFSQTEGMKRFKAEYLDEFIKVYSFADPLKKLCIDVLGLEWGQVYGNDEQKKTPTIYKWENMPGVNPVDNEEGEEIFGRLGTYYKINKNRIVFHPPGEMTAREVMQFVGTEIFRRMYYNVWVDATIKKIKSDSPYMAIICDVRFPNEADGIRKEGGKVLRLLRQPFEDEHASETALDDYPIENYLAVVDNREMSIAEQNEEIKKVLSEIQWFPRVMPTNIGE